MRVAGGQQRFDEAIAAFKGYLARFPNGPQSADAQRSILVGHPNREYLWVLSRTRAIEEPRYAEIVALAQAQGYDVTKLRRTLQPAR